MLRRYVGSHIQHSRKTEVPASTVTASREESGRARPKVISAAAGAAAAMRR